MKFKEGNKYGSKFSTTNQPDSRGRKPRLYAQVKKEFKKELKTDLSKEDFLKLQFWILEQTVAELKKIRNNPATPIFLIVLINSILSDIDNGNLETVEKMFDRCM